MMEKQKSSGGWKCFMGFWGSQPLSCLQILKLKGVEGKSVPLPFFTSLCLLPLPLPCPKYMLSFKLSTAAMLYNSLWQKLVHGNIYIVFFLSYGKHYLLKVVAWRCSIWIWAPLFHKKKEGLLVFTHFKVESLPINILNIMRI